MIWILPWFMPLLALGISLLLSPVLPSANLAMIYLAGVLITAVSTRVKPALISALLSFLIYNFFHTEPRFTLLILHREDVLTAVLLVLVAVVTGHLAARLSEKVEALQISHQWNQRQIAFAQMLAPCVNGAEIADVLQRQLASYFSRRCTISYQPDGQEKIGSVADEKGAEDTVILLEENGIVSILFLKDWCCQIRLELDFGHAVATEKRAHLEGFVNLARLAWDRSLLAQALQEETTIKEREQLRSALLSSISHDLRTPLATMIGSVSSLIELEGAFTPEQKRELLNNTLTEARRLDGYIQKLIDMTRLGQGELSLDRDWVGLDDIISVVIKRIKPQLNSVQLNIELSDNLPLLYVHPALIEQALFNVLENAVRFSPASSTIHLSARLSAQFVNIDVKDSGPGIPVNEWDSIFDMFHTLGHGDQYPSGTGLGLAICRGIIGAHGGQAIVLESSPGRGTTIRLSLPSDPEVDDMQRGCDDSDTDH
ncbi:sensor histidine kinase [Nitrincola alkalilacustris]|uniref:sensor histidine kinase n=1 Tax=Nitrincola alkalilacustris TaxID=1571224 RepID=UPI00124E83B3|nr:DUF4118 domain-containing protein [Nitrincola alkalilacustris]